MNGFLPYLALNNNHVKPIFNPDDFNYENEPVTQGDLLNYAHKQGYNNFTGLNNFTVINFNETLNDVNSQTFSYLINVSSDIQDQFNSLFQKTTAQSYTNGVTLFNSTLATPIINLNNRNLETRLIADENDISLLKTKTTSQTYNNFITTFSGTIATPALTLNGSDLNTRLTNNETQTTTNTTNIISLQLQTNTMKNDISQNKFDISKNKTDITSLQTLTSTHTTQINDLSNNIVTQLTGAVNLTGDQTIAGIKTFTSTPKIINQNIATVQDINNAIANLISGAPSTMDTLNEISQILSQDVSAVSIILKTMVDISSNQQISGLKTFTGTQTFNNGVIVTQPSSFTDISANRIQFTNNINNISPTTFSYLSGVTSNIQTQLNRLSTLLTNISFDITTNTQSFLSTTSFPTVVANNIYANNITNNKIITNSVNTNDLICNNLKTYIPLPFPVVYLYNRGVTYPLLVRDMGLIEDLNGLDTTEIIASTVFPNYKFSFLDVNKSTLLHIQNDTEEIMYNVAYQFVEPPVYYKITRIKII